MPSFFYSIDSKRGDHDTTSDLACCPNEAAVKGRTKVMDVMLNQSLDGKRNYFEAGFTVWRVVGGDGSKW